MDTAIKTIDLVKRYPTSSRQSREGRFFYFGHGGNVSSIGGFLNILKGTKGPFIEALRGISLEIKKGEIFGILGPNGAGKTTLIKVLCTLVLHDEGEVFVNGFDVQKEPDEVLRNLQAVLPESRGFNWRLTGWQNLDFYALLYGLRKDEAMERIDYLLKFTGLDERADDSYQRYSTGMQRKLLLCRALLRDTPILLFDEPTAGLDPASGAEFRGLLHEKLAKKESKTIVVSTHNLHEAQEMCDRIAILDRGKVTACDTPDRIRYMMFDEKIFSLSFYEAVYDKAQEKMLDEIEEVQGVHGVTPQIELDNSFSGISIRVDKNIDFVAILSIIMKKGLKITAVNTVEPSLEDAFLAITGKHNEGMMRFEGGRRWRSQ
jgi:ABC-2 type transport system ATP-binding protein